MIRNLKLLDFIQISIALAFFTLSVNLIVSGDKQYVSYLVYLYAIEGLSYIFFTKKLYVLGILVLMGLVVVSARHFY